MTPRMFSSLKLVGAVIGFVLFGLISYHLIWLYTIIPEMSALGGFFTSGWFLLVFAYWLTCLLQYLQPNSKWHRKMRSQTLEEFKAIGEEGASDENTTPKEEIPEVFKKFADIRIVSKSEKIIGRFNNENIHESITVHTNGELMELPYLASYSTLDEIPTQTGTNRIVIVCGEFITYGKDL